jgi:hypothetical protein
MNERIKEIWEEATVSVWPRPGKFTAGEYDYHIEKFAELIVKECAQVCLSQRDPANLNYKPSERFAEAVKQHFGVKE